MFFYDDVVRNRQALSRAFADFFGSEEWIEDATTGLRWNACTCVADSDFRPFIGDVGRRDRNFPFAVCTIADDISDGMGGIDGQIQDDLIEFPQQTGNEGQILGEAGFDIRDILPFIACHGDRAFNSFVEVCRFSLVRAGMGNGPRLRRSIASGRIRSHFQSVTKPVMAMEKTSSL